MGTDDFWFGEFLERTDTRDISKKGVSGASGTMLCSSYCLFGTGSDVAVTGEALDSEVMKEFVVPSSASTLIMLLSRLPVDTDTSDFVTGGVLDSGFVLEFGRFVSDDFKFSKPWPSSLFKTVSNAVVLGNSVDLTVILGVGELTLNMFWLLESASLFFINIDSSDILA